MDYSLCSATAHWNTEHTNFDYTTNTNIIKSKSRPKKKITAYFRWSFIWRLHEHQTLCAGKVTFTWPCRIGGKICIKELNCHRTIVGSICILPPWADPLVITVRWTEKIFCEMFKNRNNCVVKIIRVQKHFWKPLSVNTVCRWIHKCKLKSNIQVPFCYHNSSNPLGHGYMTCSDVLWFLAWGQGAHLLMVCGVTPKWTGIWVVWRQSQIL